MSKRIIIKGDLCEKFPHLKTFNSLCLYEKEVEKLSEFKGSVQISLDDFLTITKELSDSYSRLENLLMDSDGSYEWLEEGLGVTQCRVALEAAFYSGNYEWSEN